MRPVTLAEWRASPGLRQEIVQAAHRQRNREIALLLARLYRWLKPAHAARPDLASQG